jgi:sec-independent protein translocase protein TatC
MATPEQLAKQRRYAVLLAFIAGAVMTPTPDVFNQTLMALPIIVLYEIGILVSRTIQRKSN